MNVLDIVVLAVVGVSGLMSLRVGLVREVFALGALLVGILVALVLSRAVAPWMPIFFQSRAVTQILAFVVIFLVVYLVIALIGSVITRVVRSVRLSWADHLLGFAFGCVRGAVIAVLLMIGFILVLPANHGLLRNSRTLTLAGGAIELFAEFLPSGARDLVKERHAAVQALPAERSGGERTPARGIPL